MSLIKLYNLSILICTLSVSSSSYLGFGYLVRVHIIPVKKINIDHTLEAPGSLIYSVLFLNSSQEFKTDSRQN